MILITGAAGFIGKRLASSLEKDSLLLVDDIEKISACDGIKYKDYYDYRSFIEQLENDDDFAAFIAKNVDIILHQGACTDTTNYDVDDMMAHNFEYSKRLFDFSRKNNIRFIYASSAATYGHGKRGFTEDMGCEEPLNIYGRSKYAFDEYVKCYLENPATQIVGIRYFNVYGPGEDNKEKMASVVRQFYNQYRDFQQIKLFKGSDTFFRDFIHVDDIVKINKFFIKNEAVSGIYNGGTGLQRSFADIASIFEHRYSDLKVRKIKFPVTLKNKYQTNTKADVLKLFCAGYNTNSAEFISLEDGVNSYLEILEKNENNLC